MASAWTKNDEATDQLKKLLEKSGVPLELRTWAAANSFQRRVRSKQMSVMTERVVYKAESGGAVRELDFCTTMYSELRISDRVEVQLIADVLVECKFREDVEVFGFPRPRKVERPARFPFVASLTGSRLLEGLRETLPETLVSDTLGMSLVHIQGGATPRQTSQEDLVYKAGTSIHDYVAFEAIDWQDNSDPAPMIAELRDRFRRQFGKPRLITPKQLGTFATDEIGQTEINAFYTDRAFAGESLNAYVPVICQNGPIYRVRVDRNGQPKGFTPAKYLVTNLRVPGWPREIRDLLVETSPLLSVVITNPSGLRRLLTDIYTWYRNMASYLKSAPNEQKESAPIESRLWRALLPRSGQEAEAYDSRFDFAD